jgi:hypothetical protein
LVLGFFFRATHFQERSFQLRATSWAAIGIARAAGVGELRMAAVRAGFVPLAEVAVSRVLEGLTTLEEISRVIDLTDRLGPADERL